MGYDVTVLYPKSDRLLGGQEVDEAISGMSSCPGNIAMAPEVLGFKRLPHIVDRNECIEALGSVILELQKGNDGKFNDAWCLECDQKWSGLRESTQAWQKAADIAHLLPEGYKTFEGYTGQNKRQQLLEDAQRFYMYYRAGMKVLMKW